MTARSQNASVHAAANESASPKTDVPAASTRAAGDRPLVKIAAPAMKAKYGTLAADHPGMIGMRKRRREGLSYSPGDATTGSAAAP